MPMRGNYKLLKENLTTMMQNDDHTCSSSTFDCWTDQYARRSYIAHTYHHVDQKFELQGVLLDANFFPDPHTAEHILEQEGVSIEKDKLKQNLKY